MNKDEAINFLEEFLCTRDYREDALYEYIETVSTKAALYDALMSDTVEHIVQATMEQHMAEMTQCFMGNK